MLQSLLMSSSMPRTAPAWCSSRPSEQTEVTGLLTNTSAPSARWPIPVRGTKALLPTPNPHRGVLPLAQVGLTVPWSTSRSRFCRTLRTEGLIEASRPHCPIVTVPSVAMTSEAAPGRSLAGHRNRRDGHHRAVGPGRLDEPLGAQRCLLYTSPSPRD